MDQSHAVTAAVAEGREGRRSAYGCRVVVGGHMNVGIVVAGDVVVAQLAVADADASKLVEGGERK